MDKEFILLLVVFASITIILFSLKHVNKQIEEMANNKVDLDIILRMKPKKESINTIKNTIQRSKYKCYSDNLNWCKRVRNKAKYRHNYKRCRRRRVCRGRGRKRRCNRRRYCRNRRGWKINHSKINMNETLNGVKVKDLCIHTKNNNNITPGWLRRRIRNWCNKAHRRNITTTTKIHNNPHAYTNKLAKLTIYGSDDKKIKTLKFDSSKLNDPNKFTDFNFKILDIPQETIIKRYEITVGNDSLKLDNHHIQFFTSDGKMNKTFSNQGGHENMKNSTYNWNLNEYINTGINSDGASALNSYE